MAPQLTLIVLTCAVVAVCNAEAPFRGYSNRLQQQQAAPYPASGFRPDRTFNLPSSESIAQQLRLAQIKKLQQEYLQQQQLQQQQSQQTPSQLYGAPSESEASQPQIPQQPSELYGTPSLESSSSNLQPSDLTRPQRPSQQYGAPEQSSASQLQSQFVRPQQLASSQRQVQFQRQQQPSRQYGAPINKAAPEGNSDESLEESKDVENVAPQNSKPGRLTQGNQERDTENDETEATTNTATATSIPAGFVLVPISAAPAGFTPQKLALLPAAASPSFAKLQLPTIFGLQQPKLLAAPQLLAQQSYYQPQQFAFSAPLQQAW